MAKLSSDKAVIIVATDMDDDDFEIIADNCEYQENLLFLCDKAYGERTWFSTKQTIVDGLSDKEAVLIKLEGWCVSHGKTFAAVIGLDEEYHYRISEAIAQRFQLKFYPRKTLDLCSNKYLQRRLLRRNGINVPKFQLIEAGTRKFNIGFPNVLKLATGVGSVGLHLSKDKVELADNLRLIEEDVRREGKNPILEPQDYGRGKVFDPKAHFVLEEYVDGNEYSCDYLVGRGVARVIRVVRKLQEPGDFGNFAGFYLFNPDYIPEPEFRLADLEKLCTATAHALGVKFGVCMMDFRFSAGKIVVIETSVRPGIATFTELMAKIYGYISISVAIRQRVGDKAPEQIPAGTGLAATINAPRRGKIATIDFSYLDKHAEELGVMKIGRFCKVGDTCLNVGYALIKDVSPAGIGPMVAKLKRKSHIDISVN